MVDVRLQGLMIKKINGDLSWLEDVLLRFNLWMDEDAGHMMKQLEQGVRLISKLLQGSLSIEDQLMLVCLLVAHPWLRYELKDATS